MYAQFFVYKKTWVLKQEKPGEAWHVTDALRFGNASPPASDQRCNGTGLMLEQQQKKSIRFFHLRRWKNRIDFCQIINEYSLVTFSFV